VAQLLVNEQSLFYTVSKKNGATFIFAITLTNVDRF